MIGGDAMFFDDFIDNQNVSYMLLKNSVLGNKISHAYLFAINNYENVFDFVLSFVKMIVCENHYSNGSFGVCDNCNICSRIDSGNYPEIRIIESDTSVIKKEQLLELQSDFSKSSIEGKYRIYIIKDCDKMNKSASNSLLKFLEEPVEGIIAILMTNNINKLLSTIISRCQLIRLCNRMNFSDNSTINNLSLVCCSGRNEIISFRDSDKNGELLTSVIDFICYYEDNGVDILLYMKKLWYNSVRTREDNIIAFKFFVYFYYDVLRCKIGENRFLFCEQKDLISKVAKLNDIEKIVKIIGIFQYGFDMLIANLNVNLLFDDIVIRLGEV